MISGLVERKFIMHNNLPFKPLLITVALASLFPMGVASASTYGIHANSQDLIIEDQNTFEGSSSKPPSLNDGGADLFKRVTFDQVLKSVESSRER